MKSATQSIVAEEIYLPTIASSINKLNNLVSPDLTPNKLVPVKYSTEPSITIIKIVKKRETAR